MTQPFFLQPEGLQFAFCSIGGVQCQMLAVLQAASCERKIVPHATIVPDTSAGFLATRAYCSVLPLLRRDSSFPMKTM